MSQLRYDFHYHCISWTLWHGQAQEFFESMLSVLVAAMPGKWTAFTSDARVPIIADTRQEAIAFCQGRYDMSRVLFVRVPRHVGGDGEDCPGNR